ncbi:MAG: FAD-dependent oxidoreductase [Acidobacteriota bacterium]
MPSKQLKTNPPSKLSADVAIVGAGVTGLTAALLLARAGRKVVVLDKSSIATGESSRTTAHLTEILDTYSHRLIEDFGLHDARLMATSCRAALEQIAATVKSEKIACGFRRVNGYLYTEHEEDVAELREELEASRQLGMKASWTKKTPLPFSVAGALQFDNQAEFHPRRYLLRLAKIISDFGGLILEDTPVLDIKDGGPCQIQTEHGVVTARDVIVATHAPITNEQILQTKIAPYRTYVLAVKLRKGGGAKGLFWDSEDPYHYIREWVPSAGKPPLVLIGGEDHRTGQQPDTDKCFAALEQYARDHFDISSVVYRWSGQVWEPVHGVPYIGKTFSSERVHVATGFGGTGMTLGTLAAMILSDAILGRTNPWARLYCADRVRPVASAAADYIVENIDYPMHFVGDRLFGVGSDLEKIGRGEGQVVSVDGAHVAAHRDAEGKLHTCSAVCTHMGCLVKWNPAEQSWDCPCHGSRFGVDGEVLVSPATKPLSKAPGSRLQASGKSES